MANMLKKLRRKTDPDADQLEEGLGSEVRRGSDGTGGKDPLRPEIRHNMSDGTGISDFPRFSPFSTRTSTFIRTAKRHGSLPESSIPAGTLALSSANVLGLSLIHDCPEPLVDFIFVHGLGGTAMGTWSWQHDPKNFWPVWLASDPELMESRIFSFGYNADWSGQSTQSTILDFAKDLLLRMKTYSSGLGRNTQPIGTFPIIFVMHSMGGLVVKKAYIIGKGDDRFSGLVAKVYGMVFLSTPHKGSLLAETLNNILRSTPRISSKTYVGELEQGSSSLQDINEQFRTACQDLELVSFYETQKTRIAGTKKLVVNREAAILGYPKEISSALNADHHGMSKFNGLADPNYILVRNILRMFSAAIKPNPAPPIALVTQDAYLSPIDNSKVEDFLRIDEDPAEDFDSIRDRALPSSCEWILRRIAFKDWINLVSNSPRILWLTGLPAMGKSFISAFVVNHLQQNSTVGGCEYFFFKAEHQSKRSIGQMLRSIAFQFSKSRDEYRRHLLEMIDMGGLPFDRQKLNTIWEILFETMMFRQRQPHPIFWVIDGLDEAEKPETLARLLSRIPSNTNIRILIVSRIIRDLLPIFGTNIPVLHEEITIDDTVEDIRSYTRKTISNSIRVGKRQDEICNELLEKAHGSFLWVTLALNRLKDNWHTASDIESILNDFPEGMESLYMRMIEKISKQDQRPRSIAERILTWATSGFRPLEIKELEIALASEFGEFVSLKDTIRQLCEDFIVIENGRITLIHHTARHFLLNMTGEFPLKIDICSGNEYIAKLCMNFLTKRSWRRILALAQDKTPSSARSIRSPQSAVFDENPFLSYAVTLWAYHVSLAATNPELMNLVLDFLGQSCLEWINAVALLKDMRILTRAAQYLRLYAKRRRRDISQESLTSPVGSQDGDLMEWSKDLIRLVGRFANNLTQSPKSIYKYVIPFCPSSSMLHRAYGHMNTISVIGLSSDTWDDCLARLTMGNDECAAVLLCSGPFFITLIGKGTLIIWHAESCEEARRIAHGEWVQAVACSKSSTLVATAGSKTIKVWDINRGIEVHAFEKNREWMIKALSFGETDDELLIGYDDAMVESFNLSSAATNWLFLAQKVGVREHGCPNFISFSPDATQVIIGFRARPLWAFTLNAPHVPAQKCSCPEDEVYSISANESLRSMTPECVLWRPDAPVVLILYDATHIVEWNMQEDMQRKIRGVEAKDMAISDDGNLLLTADCNGTLSVWTVPEYRLLYRLEHDYGVRCLAFSPDGQRIYDVRGPFCNVWEPDALVRPDNLDREEVSRDHDPLYSESVSAVGSTGRAHITALICDSENKFFCCGKESGAVVLYDINNGEKIRKLYGHESVSSITELAWSQTERFIASADDCGRIIAKKLRKPSVQKSSWGVLPLLDIHVNEAVQQLLFSSSEEYLLISSSTCDWVWSLKEKVEICRAQHKKTGRRWTNHPHDSRLVVWIDPENVQIFSWSSLQEVRVQGQLSILEGGQAADAAVAVLADCSTHQVVSTEPVEYVKSLACMRDAKIVVEIFPDTGIDKVSRRRLALLDINPNPAQTLQLHPIRELTGKFNRFIGSWKDQLIFRDHQYRFSTWNANAGGEFIGSHFFMPKDWLSPDMLDLCIVNGLRTILCPRNGEVAIIKSGIKL